jgi:hypothetical protein
MDILTIFRQKSGRDAILPAPPSRQSTFQSVSGCGPRRVRGMAGSQSGLFSCSFFFLFNMFIELFMVYNTYPPVFRFDFIKIFENVIGKICNSLSPDY